MDIKYVHKLIYKMIDCTELLDKNKWKLSNFNVKVLLFFYQT